MQRRFTPCASPPFPVARVNRRIARALEFVEAATCRNGLLPSFVSPDPTFSCRMRSPEEVFSATLALSFLRDAALPFGARGALLDTVAQSFTGDGLMHFFVDRRLLPADLDCTALALRELLEHGRTPPCDPQRVVDLMVRNVNAEGVVRVYVTDDPKRRERIDAVVCVNVLHLLYALGRQADARATEAFVAEHLRGAWRHGTRYYPSPELFLLFLSRLVTDYPAARPHFYDTLRRCVQERLNSAEPTTSLELAARVIAGRQLALDVGRETAALVETQGLDGAWPAAPCFRYGRTPRYFGSEALATTLAASALHRDATVCAAR